MEGINAVFIVGNLGKTPELINAKGTSLLRLSVGVNESHKDGNGNWSQKPTWIPVVLLGKRAEALHRKKLLKKGTLVAVQGRVNPRSFETRDGDKRYTIDIQVTHRFSFWSFNKAGWLDENGDATEGPDGPPPPDSTPPPGDDDMPF
jgi:single-strand DNA-binding protein